jgi:hypothetical protein
MDRNPVKLAFAIFLGLIVVSLLRGTQVRPPAEALAVRTGGSPVTPGPAQAARSQTLPARPSTQALRPPGGSNDQDAIGRSYQQHVGLNACRVDTGAYEGEVVGVNYDGRQWMYAIRHVQPPPAVTRQPRLPIGNLGDGRHYEVNSAFGARFSRGPATDYTSNDRSVPGRPTARTPRHLRASTRLARPRSAELRGDGDRSCSCLRDRVRCPD